MVFIAYQMMFTIFPRPHLGALTNRVPLEADCLFLTMDSLLFLSPSCTCCGRAASCSVGSGALRRWTVVDNIAGMAALASILYVGRRRVLDRGPHTSLVALRTGLLWFWWYGFNAGSVMRVDAVTGTAYLNLILLVIRSGGPGWSSAFDVSVSPSFLGLLTGAVPAPGLATVTPRRICSPNHAVIISVTVAESSRGG